MMVLCAQKLSKSVTEAMQEAHSKSVEVSQAVKLSKVYHKLAWRPHACMT